MTEAPLPGPRPAKTPTLAELATGLGCSERTVTRRKAAGMPTDSVDAARGWLAEQASVKPQREAVTRDEKAEAQYWNTAWRRARAEREQMELARLKHDYIPRADVDQNFVSFSLEWCRGLELMERTLPPKLWAAETIGDMATILEEAHRTLRQRISRERPVTRAKLWRGRGRPQKDGAR